MKNTKQATLEKEYLWVTSSRFPELVQDTLLSAASAIQNWLNSADSHNLQPMRFLSQRIGMVLWEPSSYLWRKVGFHHVEFHTVFIDPGAITVETAVHEMAHILDNSLGAHALTSVFGSGPADEMIRSIGGEPELFLPRFNALRYEAAMRSQKLELNPTAYGRTCGPAEDFAESFRLAVLHPELLKAMAPLRYEWFLDWRIRLTKKTDST